MDLITSNTGVAGMIAIILVTIAAGYVKGAIGFAMPMIMISGLATFLPGDLALALLIIPTLLSNFVQAMGDGLRPALASARLFWRYLLIVLVFLAGSAQLVSILPQSVLFLILGGPIVAFASWQLTGRRVHIPPHMRGRIEILIGSIAGFVGGLSGVWGPPTVLYLTAIGTPKADSVRVQGVIYLAGACVLTAAHLNSGILNAQTLPLSFAMVIPAGIGLIIGMRTRGTMDEARFRRWTLIVLIVVGANLVRRGLVQTFWI